MLKTTDNLLDPGLCPHNGKLIYCGLQEDGHGGAFALYTCPNCGTTLSMQTIEQHRKERGNNVPN